LLPVLFSAAYWEEGLHFFLHLGVLALIYFYSPVLSITVHDLSYLLSFLIFFACSCHHQHFGFRLKNQADVQQRGKNEHLPIFLKPQISGEDKIETILNIVAKVVSIRWQVMLSFTCQIIKVTVGAGQRLIKAKGVLMSWMLRTGYIP
jgi:two-component system sensor histidine kinase KdpD